ERRERDRERDGRQSSNNQQPIRGEKREWHHERQRVSRGDRFLKQQIEHKVWAEGDNERCERRPAGSVESNGTDCRQHEDDSRDRSPAANAARNAAIASPAVPAALKIRPWTATAAASPGMSLSGRTAVNQYSGAVPTKRAAVIGT